MANNFTKQETVAFEEKWIPTFEDQLAMLDLVGGATNISQTLLERSGDVIWRPVEPIVASYEGPDQTLNFRDQTEMAVPVSVNRWRSTPLIFDSLQLRDSLQEERFGIAARDKLASDINLAIVGAIANFGTLFVKRTGAASGYDDIAQADALMNEQGVPMGDRVYAANSRDYNAMAGNLAARQDLSGDISSRALRDAYLGRIAGFGTYKLDYSSRLTAALGGAGITINTQAAGGNRYDPKAMSTALGTGEKAPVDNRFQVVTVSSTTNVKQGDRFTIAGVEAAHHVTKESTGQLKTFLVRDVLSATTMVISPPIIPADGTTVAQQQYANVVISAPSATAAIVWLNTVTAPTNFFFRKGSIEVLPGRPEVPDDAGVKIMRADVRGIPVTMTKWFDMKVMKQLVRFDVYFGVTNKQPEMSGVEMFNQT